MTRVINFNAGPATLPLSVIEQTRDELVDFRGSGMSILEHSHRGGVYGKVHAEAKALLTELMAIPDTHEILFMQGGASAQFALVPMNFLRPGQVADYVVTGTWSENALKEANVVGKAREAGTGKVDGRYVRVPGQSELVLDPAAPYVHVTSNNTIMGTQFRSLPATGDVPLVVDMSSDILAAPVDLSRVHLAYAGAQKNLGPAGVTVLILRKDWIAEGREDIPSIFRYSTFAAKDSLPNTAPTFAIYLVRNVLSWVKDNGGAQGMKARNDRKADLLYGVVREHPTFYRCPIEEPSRSVMNAVFRLPSEELEATFVAEAASHGMVGLKGHRSVGGIRVSMYNAMEPASIETLAGFMREFVRTHG